MRPKVQLQVRKIILRKQQLDITLKGKPVFISDQWEFCVRINPLLLTSVAGSISNIEPDTQVNAWAWGQSRASLACILNLNLIIHDVILLRSKFIYYKVQN
jgi:hypothetical protein